MVQARRLSSIKLYSTYIVQWKSFCEKHNSHHIHATVPVGLTFLQFLFQRGLGYSALNTARSALSSIIILPGGILFGAHPDVKVYMRGAFNAKPPTPRYISTWEPSQVLTLLQSWFPASEISIDKLVMKIAMIIMLITGQRPQILSRLRLDSMKITESAFEFALQALDLKQGRPGYKPQCVILRKFPSNPKICIFKYLQTYLDRTALIRKGLQPLFLTTTKPYRVASSNTISRWLKTVLNTAGIDIERFSAGSSRAAASSAAKQAGLPIDQILKAGGWAKQDTFTRFYDREIIPCSFGDAVLSRLSNNAQNLDT
jgi:integrase